MALAKRPANAGLGEPASPPVNRKELVKELAAARRPVSLSGVTSAKEANLRPEYLRDKSQKDQTAGPGANDSRTLPSGEHLSSGTRADHHATDTISKWRMRRFGNDEDPSVARRKLARELLEGKCGKKHVRRRRGGEPCD